jgi:hypothetical protein
MKYAPYQEEFLQKTPLQPTNDFKPPHSPSYLIAKNCTKKVKNHSQQ